MAEDETGWSEKGKGASRGKRVPAAQGAGTVSESGATAEVDTPTRPERPSKRAAAEPEGRKSSVVRARSDDTGARKVAKAAATAGQRDVAFVSRLGFPALIAVICLLGIGVVFYAWTTREALATPSQADHWHAVYGVYDCTAPGEEKYVPPFQSALDDVGIHSHGDGVIHIHPFFELSSGPRATMNHFLESMQIDVTPEAVTLDTGARLVAGTECLDGSGPAEIRILHWDFDFQATADEPPDPVVYTDDFGAIKFDNDREVYIIAFAGPDADIPPPPQDRFNTLNSVTGAIDYNPTDLTPRDSGVTVDGETDDGTGLVPSDSGASTDDSGSDDEPADS